MIEIIVNATLFGSTVKFTLNDTETFVMKNAENEGQRLEGYSVTITVHHKERAQYNVH